MAAPKVDHGFACSSVPFLKTRYRETVIRTYNPTNNYSCYRIYRVSCLSCLNVILSYHISNLPPRRQFRSTFIKIPLVEHTTLIELG